MGKTNAPLNILVEPDYLEEHRETFEELQEKGHKVFSMDANVAYDGMLGPHCWRSWTDENGKPANLEMFLKSARAAKRSERKASKGAGKTDTPGSDAEEVQ